MMIQIVNGSIDANWVLVILAAIAGTLALIFLNDIRASIKNVVHHQAKQDVQIAKNDARTEYAHERIDKLEKVL